MRDLSSAVVIRARCAQRRPGGLVPVYAHMSLIRTTYESALLSYWLLEPGLVPNGRRARGVAAQVADYDERRKFEEAAGIKIAPPPPGKLAAQRLADLKAVSTQLGLTRQNKKGETILVVTVPATVDLFDKYEPAMPNAKGQWRYRLYSGYAHAKQWATTIGAQRQALTTRSGVRSSSCRASTTSPSIRRDGA